MRTSAIILLSSAAAAIAGPALNKRVYETQWTTVYEEVTVTAGQEPVAPTPAPVYAPAVPVGEVVTITKGPDVGAPKPKPSEVVNAPAPAQPAPVYVPNGSMKDAALYHHNVHRSNHSAPAMTWNDKIAASAQEAADSCVFKHQMDINGGGYGQNLAMWGTSNNAGALGEDGAIARAASNMWYGGEFASYASFFGKEPSMGNFGDWGHLSQLLWADSTGLGCAVKLCKKGSPMSASMDAWYMVCNYYPAGNVGGRYAANVKAPLGKAPVIA